MTQAGVNRTDRLALVMLGLGVMGIATSWGLATSQLLDKERRVRDAGRRAPQQAST